ncbi:hypothetical protein [uncultured Maribacter sp.]
MASVMVNAPIAEIVD